MSEDLEGGHDYSKTRRHYDNFDFVSVPFNATQDFYPVGAMAFLANQGIFNPLSGWSLHPRVPTRAPFFFGPIPFPSPGPQFEGKRFQFRSTRTARIRFGDIRNVELLLPPNQTMEFWQRSYLVFVRSFATAGTLNVWIEG